VNERERESAHVHIHTHTHIHIHIKRENMHIIHRKKTHTHTHTHIHTRTYIRIHTYVYTRIQRHNQTNFTRTRTHAQRNTQIYPHRVPTSGTRRGSRSRSRSGESNITQRGCARVRVHRGRYSLRVGRSEVLRVREWVRVRVSLRVSRLRERGENTQPGFHALW
jgi:hypothetical protein